MVGNRIRFEADSQVHKRAGSKQRQSFEPNLWTELFGLHWIPPQYLLHSQLSPAFHSDLYGLRSGGTPWAGTSGFLRTAGYHLKCQHSSNTLSGPDCVGRPRQSFGFPSRVVKNIELD